MNIQEQITTMTRDYAHKVAELTDSAAYAMMMIQAEELRKKGEDLTKYEMIFVTTDTFQETKNGFRVERCIRLHKIGTPV